MFKLWSYERITITANIGDPIFFIKSDDSSFLKSILGLFLVRSCHCGFHLITRYSSWNSHLLYDVIRNEDRSIDIYLSPYRKSCILLSNPYENAEYPLMINISVQRSRSRILMSLRFVLDISCCYHSKLHFVHLCKTVFDESCMNEQIVFHFSLLLCSFYDLISNLHNSCLDFIRLAIAPCPEPLEVLDCWNS